MPESTIAQSVAKARRAITESQKRDRMRREFPAEGSNYPTEKTVADINTPASPSLSVETDVANMVSADNSSSLRPRSSADAVATRKENEKDNPLYPLEKNVIRYCLRYAFLTKRKWFLPRPEKLRKK